MGVFFVWKRGKCASESPYIVFKLHKNSKKNKFNNKDFENKKTKKHIILNAKKKEKKDRK